MINTHGYIILLTPVVQMYNQEHDTNKSHCSHYKNACLQYIHILAIGLVYTLEYIQYNTWNYIP